jgi:hypothetical protein
MCKQIQKKQRGSTAKADKGIVSFVIFGYDKMVVFFLFFTSIRSTVVIYMQDFPLLTMHIISGLVYLNFIKLIFFIKGNSA